MSIIEVKASRNYNVVIERGLLGRAAQEISAVIKGRRVIVISDSNVFPLYGEALINNLSSNGFTAEQYVFPAGEATKTA